MFYTGCARLQGASKFIGHSPTQILQRPSSVFRPRNEPQIPASDQLKRPRNDLMAVQGSAWSTGGHLESLFLNPVLSPSCHLPTVSPLLQPVLLRASMRRYTPSKGPSPKADVRSKKPCGRWVPRARETRSGATSLQANSDQYTRGHKGVVFCP